MLKSEVQIGGKYLAPVSGQLTIVRINDIVHAERYKRRASTSYVATNLKTGREVYFRSAAKLRRAVTDEEYQRWLARREEKGE